MHLLRPKISLKQGCFKFVAELYFFILDHRSLIWRALEILMPFNSTIMLSSIDFLPLNSNPKLIILLYTLMYKLSKISDNTWTVTKYYFPWDNLLSVLYSQVVLFKSFGLCLKIVLFFLLRFRFLLLGLLS